MSFMHHETSPPLLCMEIAQLFFPLPLQFFCRWKVPALINLINYQLQTVDQSIFLTGRITWFPPFSSRHTANWVWLLPKVASYTFNDVELTQLSSSLSSGSAHVNAAGSSVVFCFFPSSNSHTQRSHYFTVVTLTAIITLEHQLEDDLCGLWSLKS